METSIRRLNHGKENGGECSGRSAADELLVRIAAAAREFGVYRTNPSGLRRWNVSVGATSHAEWGGFLATPCARSDGIYAIFSPAAADLRRSLGMAPSEAGHLAGGLVCSVRDVR